MKNFTKQFGGKLTNTLVEYYAKSPQWQNNKFQNQEETTIAIGLSKLPGLLYKHFFERAGRQPQAPLPIAPFNKAAFLKTDAKAKFIWYGHAVVLMRINDKTILIDPMLGNNASPIAPFATKRFSNNTLSLIDDFPDIDLLLLTHDHYDHLDYDSIQKLKSKTKHYFVALGVARHLQSWGIDNANITEFDWWHSTTINEIKITFTPSRHFSGRGLTDRAKSLWGGWIFNTPTENIWFSGDGGYGNHFKAISEKGPFDFAFMECGQYNENWHAIHMYPEESVRAAVEAKAKNIMALHWAGFSLAQHPWTEPIERFIAECEKQKQPFTVPALGTIFSANATERNPWWHAH